MKLRFIGKDGSLGSIHGKVYKVEITSWPNDENIWLITEDKRLCPYGSLEMLAKNWEDV